MVARTDIPLILLYTANSSSVDGSTRFQKLLFLAQQEGDLPNYFEFRPYKYGPYSAELQDVLGTLETEGLLQRTTERTSDGQDFHRFSITPRGIQRVQQLLTDDSKTALFDRLQEIKRRFFDWDNTRLLRYTYTNYEACTTQSELDYGALYDPDIGVRDSAIEEISHSEPNQIDEPTWHTETTEEEPELSVPEWVNTYLEMTADIELISEVYFEERSADTDRLITVLADRDFDVMERIYDTELALRSRFPDADLAFEVTVSDARSITSKTATRIHTEG